eukprot:scaffold819_cov146-Skeletonema_menzelii.AAC.1
MSADSPRDQVGQLIVDFPTASLQPTATVRFASSPTVIPIRSTLTMIRDKDELWYSKTEEETMRIQRTLDAATTTIRRTLLEPSAEDLEDGGVHETEGACCNIGWLFSDCRQSQTMTKFVAYLKGYQAGVQSEHTHSPRSGSPWISGAWLGWRSQDADIG